MGMAKVLVAIPHDRFNDDEYLAVINRLDNGIHEVQIGSTHHTEAKGQFGLLVKPDVNLGFVEPDDYDALVFIGGQGVEEFFLDNALMNLIRRYYTEKKLIAAIGLAVELLIYASIVAGHKVTCMPEMIQKIQGAGGYYTGSQTQIDRDILTATDDRAKDEFAQQLLKCLDYLNTKGDLR